MYVSRVNWWCFIWCVTMHVLHVAITPSSCMLAYVVCFECEHPFMLCVFLFENPRQVLVYWEPPVCSTGAHCNFFSPLLSFTIM